ncbi:MAG TPA: metalloregulator ArsR/SmtB family transcription factor [Longimicrobiales bacterium]|nr:metalloregulator ArsR/SmtB family transcription factor [Longimicrobiales bacterium]
METGERVAREFSADVLEQVAGRFKVLAEPLRLELLNAMREGERTVTELVEATGAGQANVSRHLGLLHGAGLVGRRKEGLNVFYRIADPGIFELCELVCGSLEQEWTGRLRALEGGQAPDSL